MTLDLEKLERVASAADLDEWPMYLIPERVTNIELFHDDAVFVSTFNPAVALELIAEIRRLRTELTTKEKK